jgi:hypothetical protein
MANIKIAYLLQGVVIGDFTELTDRTGSVRFTPFLILP